jgi:DNA ligase-1
MVKKLKPAESKMKPARVESEMKPDQWFEPSFVLEVAGAEITRSSVHTAARKEGKGLALRFPRFRRWREDKKAEQATTVKEIERMRGGK